MSRRSTILSLPADILDELKRRLIDGSFSGFYELEFWLKSLGYEISKSSIHRFSSVFSANLDQELRLKCAEIASRYSDSESVTVNAGALLLWVKNGR